MWTSRKEGFTHLRVADDNEGRWLCAWLVVRGRQEKQRSITLADTGNMTLLSFRVILPIMHPCSRQSSLPCVGSIPPSSPVPKRCCCPVQPEFGGDPRITSRQIFILIVLLLRSVIKNNKFVKIKFVLRANYFDKRYVLPITYFDVHDKMTLSQRPQNF